MSDQQHMATEFRLAAIEYMLARIFVAFIKNAGWSADQADIAMDAVARHAKQQLFPGLDPAMADMASDEFGIAVSRLTAAIKDMVRQA